MRSGRAANSATVASNSLVSTRNSATSARSSFTRAASCCNSTSCSAVTASPDQVQNRMGSPGRSR